MDCTPAQPSQTSTQFAWRITHAKPATFLCALLIVIPVLNDIFRPHVNLTILFLIPMVFCAWLGQRRMLRKVLVLCIVLTYLGLAARLQFFPRSPYWRWGLLNRTFVVIALLIGGYLLEAMLTNLQHRASWRSLGVDAEHAIIEEIIFSSQRFAALFIAIVLAGGIFVLDLITPGQLNCPILYSVPLLIVIWTRSHVWLWSILSLLVALAVIGWFVGDPPTTTPNLLIFLRLNRVIAICMLLLFAVIMHLATSPYAKK
jgi:hypothetical protein